MNHNDYVLERLAADRRAARMRETDRDRLLSRARERSSEGPAGAGIRGPRAWLADELVRLAGRLSPAHRDLPCARHASIGAPQAN